MQFNKHIVLMKQICAMCVNYLKSEERLEHNITMKFAVTQVRACYVVAKEASKFTRSLIRHFI